MLSSLWANLAETLISIFRFLDFTSDLSIRKGWEENEDMREKIRKMIIYNSFCWERK